MWSRVEVVTTKHAGKIKKKDTIIAEGKNADVHVSLIHTVSNGIYGIHRLGGRGSGIQVAEEGEKQGRLGCSGVRINNMAREVGRCGRALLCKQKTRLAKPRETRSLAIKLFASGETGTS